MRRVLMLLVPVFTACATATATRPVNESDVAIGWTEPQLDATHGDASARGEAIRGGRVVRYRVYGSFVVNEQLVVCLVDGKVVSWEKREPRGKSEICAEYPAALTPKIASR